MFSSCKPTQSILLRISKLASGGLVCTILAFVILILGMKISRTPRDDMAEGQSL